MNDETGKHEIIDGISYPGRYKFSFTSLGQHMID